MHFFSLVVKQFLSLVMLSIVPALTAAETVPCMSTVLGELGVESPAQRAAFNRILCHAGYLAPQQTLDERFPQRETLAECLRDVVDFIAMTQDVLVRRKGTQERWEVGPALWMRANEQELRRDLATLGITQTRIPTKKHYDAVCVLGALLGTMRGRLKHTADLLLQGIYTDRLVLLTGERHVTPGQDGSQEDLEQIAQEQGVANAAALMEVDLMRFAYHYSLLRGLRIPMEEIDGRKGDLPRATTESTARDFARWLKGHPEVKSVLFISNQPHIAYQAAIIDAVRTEQSVTVDTDYAGPGVVGSHVGLHDLVGALGATLWARAPAALLKLGLVPSEQAPDTKEKLLELQKLYQNNPLFFHSLSIGNAEFCKNEKITPGS